MHHRPPSPAVTGSAGGTQHRASRSVRSSPDYHSQHAYQHVPFPLPSPGTATDGSSLYGTSAHLVRVPSPHGQVRVVDGGGGSSNNNNASSAAASAAAAAAAAAADHSAAQGAALSSLDRQVQEQAATIARVQAELRGRDTLIEELRRRQDEAAADRQLHHEESLRRELSALHAEIDEKRKAVDSLELATDASRSLTALRAEAARLQSVCERQAEKLTALDDRLRAEQAERHLLRRRAEAAEAAAAAADAEGAARARAAEAEVAATREAMRRDLDAVVGGAERELAAVRTRLGLAEARARRGRERTTAAEGREEQLRLRLEAAAEAGERARAEAAAEAGAAEVSAARAREAALRAAGEDAVARLTERLVAAEAEVGEARAAAAETKAAALMTYFSERGGMEQEMSERADVVCEEVRSCARLVRRMLERYTASVAPPPGAADDKLLTLKQLVWPGGGGFFF